MSHYEDAVVSLEIAESKIELLTNYFRHSSMLPDFQHTFESKGHATDALKEFFRNDLIISSVQTGFLLEELKRIGATFSSPGNSEFRSIITIFAAALFSNECEDEHSLQQLELLGVQVCLDMIMPHFLIWAESRKFCDSRVGTSEEFVCPLPMEWDRISRLLHQARESSERDIPEPPIPLILNGWLASDREKYNRWNDTMAWAYEHGFSHLIPKFSEENKCIGDIHSDVEY